MKGNRRFHNSILSLILLGMLTGVVTACLLSLFLLAARYLAGLSGDFFAYVSDNPLFLPVLLAASAALAFVAALVQRVARDARGSGIPLAEGCARGIFSPAPVSSLLGLFSGTLLSVLASLNLGQEGPCIGMGGLVGHNLARTFRAGDATRRYLVTGGACAGLAVAFNAPFTGMCFALEETHRRFTPKILIAAFSAILPAVLLSRLFLGGAPLLADWARPALPVRLIYVPVLTGLACGGLGILFNFCYKFCAGRFAKIKRDFLRLLPAFLTVAVVGFFLYDGVGTGERFLKQGYRLSLLALFAVFFVRFALTILSSSSGATGGLFIPMLALGAGIGMITAKLLALAGLAPEQAEAFVLVCLSSFFAATVRAPLTAIVLSVELAGSADNLLFLIVSVAAAYILSECVRQQPLYEEMLDGLTERKAPRDKLRMQRCTRSLTEESFLCGRAVREILWPHNSLVVALFRDGRQIVPDGETILLAGDVLVVEGECETEGRLSELLDRLI